MTNEARTESSLNEKKERSLRENRKKGIIFSRKCNKQKGRENLSICNVSGQS